MRMIDGDESFAALAHEPLRAEEFFGRSLVRNRRRARDVAERINRRRFTPSTAEQPATLFRRAGSRVGLHLLDECAPQTYVRHLARPCISASARTVLRAARVFERALERDE